MACVSAPSDRFRTTGRGHNNSSDPHYLLKAANKKGFSFWSYELSKRYLNTGEEDGQEASWKVLLCGGIAGVVTWASVFPLDVVKTRMQTQGIRGEGQGLLGGSDTKKGSWGVAKEAYRQEGWKVFFRGLGVCSSRAFLVNAVQVILP